MKKICLFHAIALTVGVGLLIAAFVLATPPFYFIGGLLTLMTLYHC
jgi:hypothetical protein